MAVMHSFRFPLLLGAFLIALSGPLAAQTQPAGDAPKPPAATEQLTPEQQAAREAQRRSVEEFVEASKLPGTAGLPECVWTGRRIAALLWRDDIDTARRHLELYERFGCPTEHLKLAFRCLVRQGNIDPKTQERLGGRVQQCWVNPDYVAAPAQQ
ncbi:hypothetical protein GCM10007301_50030 [Azorhizobium oxalatiphilum]|uniref:Beta-1-3, beta-1-6-glucan biosynthesis protein n=1 Tax=Azorhizobium oxalatiphilum TaxID=980631 RepID=A0A917CCH7_9HYPH|nr:hypothetical protein [Azorhizobium oxalatiphilum]GGF84044.1 hypothetical protein GCM10007301_50030 [Azorhizobium oxalatiphilum]